MKIRQRYKNLPDQIDKLKDDIQKTNAENHKLRELLDHVRMFLYNFCNI